MSSEEMKKFRKIVNEDNNQPAWVRKRNSQMVSNLPKWVDATGNNKVPAHLRKSNPTPNNIDSALGGLEPNKRDRRPGHEIRRDKLGKIHGRSFKNETDPEGTSIFLKKQASESKKLDHLEKRIDRALKEALREMNRTHQAVYETASKVEKLEALQAEINNIKKKKPSGKEEKLAKLKTEIKNIKASKE